MSNELANERFEGLTVATFNIHHGAPMRKQLPQIGATADAVSRLEADLIAVQEVDVRSTRTWRQDQARRIAEPNGYVPLFMPVRALAGGWYGIALLSKRPVESFRLMHLPTAPGREQRGAILFTHRAGSTLFSAAAVHLQAVLPSERERSEAMAQLRVVLETLLRWPGPHLIFGDFNLRPEAARPILSQFGFTPADHGPTFPSTTPAIQIDWIATRGIDIGNAEVIEHHASDHRPVKAQLFVPQCQ